jgi:hypothetical protein
MEFYSVMGYDYIVIEAGKDPEPLYDPEEIPKHARLFKFVKLDCAIDKETVAVYKEIKRG